MHIHIYTFYILDISHWSDLCFTICSPCLWGMGVCVCVWVCRDWVVGVEGEKGVGRDGVSVCVCVLGLASFT